MRVDKNNTIISYEDKITDAIQVRIKLSELETTDLVYKELNFSFFEWRMWKYFALSDHSC